MSFFDTDDNRWVTWSPGVDAPPRPPEWDAGTQPSEPVSRDRSAASTRLGRPRWASRWRLLPLILIIVALVIAVLQALHSSGSQPSKEAAAAAALLGHCLAQDGTAGGHPKYSAKPVDCSSPRASVKVVDVVPTTPGSPSCPSDSTGVVLVSTGVQYPHILCVLPVGRG
jgi:hypothetical protein